MFYTKGVLKMKEKLVSNGVLIGIGVNIIILICMYFLEYRVSLLESKHPVDACHYHE